MITPRTRMNGVAGLIDKPEHDGCLRADLGERESEDDREEQHLQ